MNNSVKTLKYEENMENKNADSNIQNEQLTDILYVPIFANKIACCFNTNYSQTFRSSAKIFTLTTTDTVYSDNAPININTVCYSYNILGSTIPFNFYINGQPYTFSFNNSPIGNCSINLIPEGLEDEINAALTAANETISLLNGVNSASTNQDKLNLLYSAGQSSAQSDLLAIEAIQTLINEEYPSPNENTPEDFLTKIAQATNDLATATNLLGFLAPSFAVSSDDADSFEESIVSGAGIITDVANAIINSIPTPSSTVISYAQAAITNANTAISDAATAVTSLEYTDFTSSGIDLYNAIKNAILALALLVEFQRGSPLFNLLQRIDIINNAIDNTLEGLQLTYDASTNSSPLPFIQTAIEFFATSASYIIEALTFTTTTTSEPLYDSFIAKINLTNNCKCSSSEPNCLFLEPISSLSICNLSITVCGTIGLEPFTATSSFENLNSLSSLGYSTINIANNLCCPCMPFTILQNLIVSFAINDVIPIGNYTTSSTNSFSANIFSTVCINSDLSVIVKDSLPALTNTLSTINCQNQI